MTGKTFYGGEINCMQGEIKVENLDSILDLIDEYIEVKEADNEYSERQGQD